MAHYAFIDENNIVVQVITGRDENEVVNGISNWEKYYASIHNKLCVRTSYNGNIRKNFAGIGFAYDAKRDAFIPPKPFDSWILNEETCQWQPPIDYPTDGLNYQWDEATINWLEIQGE